MRRPPLLSFIRAHRIPQAKSASQEQLSENAHYKVLLEHASLLEHNVSETRDQARRLADELSHLQLCRREWEEHQNVCPFASHFSSCLIFRLAASRNSSHHGTQSHVS